MLGGLQVVETRHAAEGLCRHDGVHRRSCDFTHGDMMQRIERAVVKSSTFRPSCREAQDRVPVRRHVSGPHGEGNPIVCEFDETCELFVVKGRVRADRANRRAEANRGTFHIIPEYIVHLEEPLSTFLSSSADRAPLDGTVYVPDAVRHHDRTNSPWTHRPGAAAQSAFRPPGPTEERPDPRTGPSADVPLR